jgi:hypothetical protein
MRGAFLHLIELICGIILLAFGLIHLFGQEKALNRLIATVNNDIVRTEGIAAQGLDAVMMNANIISDEMLYAIVMGYREYPIIINGTEIATDGMEYEYYFTLIKAGSYQRSYVFDEMHNIRKVNYTYIGT